jgi:hypothetical protein
LGVIFAKPDRTKTNHYGKKMTENPFKNKFSDIGDENLIKRLAQKSEYEPLAVEAMTDEALKRGLINDKSETSIILAVQNSQTVEKDESSAHSQSKPSGSIRTKFYRIASIVFLVGGILGLLLLGNAPIAVLISSGVLLLIAYNFHDLAKKEKTKPPALPHQKAEKGYILAGYFLTLLILFITYLSFTGWAGILGVSIGVDLRFSKVNGDSAYDEQSKKHGLFILLLAFTLIIGINIFRT